MSGFKKKSKKKKWIIDKSRWKTDIKKTVAPNKIQNIKMIQRFTGKRGN